MNNNEKIKKKAYEDLLDDIKRSYMVIKIICIVCCILFLFGTVFCIINIVNVNGKIFTYDEDDIKEILEEN